MSLYIPGAGFLWADDMVWDLKSGAFRSEDDVLGNNIDVNKTGLDHLLGRQPRVIFADKFGRIGRLVSMVYSRYKDLHLTGPWYLEPTLDGKHNTTDEVITSRIWPGQSVHLRNCQSGDYVTASMSGNAVTDMYDDMTDDSIRRLYIR